jgi:hypothetical protein
MKFKCLACGSDRAHIRKEEGYSVKHCNIDDFPPNSEVWDKDWRLYCFYGIDNKEWIEFTLVCCNCDKIHGPAESYDKLVKQMQNYGVLI